MRQKEYSLLESEVEDESEMESDEWKLSAGDEREGFQIELEGRACQV